LTVIKGFNTFLLKGAAGALNDTQKEYVNTIDQNIMRLANIINDMVDISRIERGTFAMRKEPNELVSVLNEAIESMHFIAEENGINMEKNFELDSIVFRFDKGRMQQAITNLINNAIRYSKKGEEIIISLARADKDKMPGHVRERLDGKKAYYFLSVKDSGEGIEKKYLEKVFERFFQVENANTRKHPGAGLGLSITRDVLEAHGGYVWAESEGLGKGTQICMVLPG
jgi:signal transduction histidine kinase